MTQTIDIYNLEGKVTGKMDLPEAIFGVDASPELLAQAIRVYLANQRQATSKVKTRGDVDRTTHKVWKQKGTGRARHGSRGAPIFVGGGVAHGPSGDQNYALRLPKRMRRQAILGALAENVKAGQVVMIEGLEELAPTAKALTNVLKNIHAEETKSLIMLGSANPTILRAGRNLSQVSFTQAKRLNVYELVNTQKLIIHKPAIDALLATFASQAGEAKPAGKAKSEKKAEAK